MHVPGRAKGSDVPLTKVEKATPTSAAVTPRPGPDPQSSQTSASKVLRSSPPANVEIAFTKGIPSRVSVKHLIPEGERFHGGYYDTVAGYHSYCSNLVGVTFDARTCELVYDGRDPDPQGIAENPSRSFWIGSELRCSDTHWQWPPTAMPIPQPVAGKHRALANPAKHTAAVYCPWDQKIRIFGGDFSTWGLLGAGMNGRAIMWDWHPITNNWKLGFAPPGGIEGDVLPLSPDIMGMCWDTEFERLFIAWGNSRPGYANAKEWAAHGNKASVYPADNAEADMSNMPCFTFDPKLSRPKFALAGVAIPWDMNNQVHEIAYDSTTHRIYAAKDVGGLRVYWLDTHGNPLKWQSVDVSLAAGAPNNLTGSGDHRNLATGYWPIHVDEKGRRLLFMDARTPAILAFTLPGHPLGEGKVQLIARMPVVDLTTAAMGLTASIAGAWIPEHRSLVVFWEPLWHQVGPYTASLTIDVDTGAISAGPRWPNYDGEARPWFPNRAIWYPPTQELIVYGFMYDHNTLPNVTVPQTNYRYRWVA